jgi:hypothetical protein
MSLRLRQNLRNTSAYLELGIVFVFARVDVQVEYSGQ